MASLRDHVTNQVVGVSAFPETGRVNMSYAANRSVFQADLVRTGFLAAADCAGFVVAGTAVAIVAGVLSPNLQTALDPAWFGIAAACAAMIVAFYRQGQYARSTPAGAGALLGAYLVCAALVHCASLVATNAVSPGSMMLPLVWVLSAPSVLLSRQIARRFSPMLDDVAAMTRMHPGQSTLPGPFLNSPRPKDGMPTLGRGAKIAFDRVGASAICLIAAPVLLAVAVVVTRDGGPLLFRHRRVGHNGQTFMCLKFRTMVVNADSALAELLSRDPAAREEWEATHKLRDDPRVTRYGRVLRNTSLDELPQLLNVLRGEMSLVGPRPIVPAEVSRYGDDIGLYFAAIPGLTGLWQVSGRSETSYERRVELDCEYVRTWTFWGDIMILLKTIPAVVFKRGAV